MPTLQSVLLIIHLMQPFRPSAPIQEEPTFIQTCHSSLESQVLDFTRAYKDRVYQISLKLPAILAYTSSVIMIFWKKHPWHLNHLQWGRRRNNSRTYICHPFLSALHMVSTGLLYFFFLSVLNVPSCHMTGSHVIVPSPVKWPHTIGKICVKMPSKSRQNQGSNGFSSRGTWFTVYSAA